MAPIQAGTPAPVIRGVSFKRAPLAVLFYKVNCPVCQMAAPTYSRFEDLYPGRIFGVGQDPEPKLKGFSEEWGLTFPSVHDLDPFPASTAYGVETVPTLVLIGAGDRKILDVVESWDRRSINRVSKRLAEMIGIEYQEISTHGDGLPPFRPG